MRQIVTTSHVLEIAGPRGQIWRPITDKFLLDASRMAREQNFEAALEAAQNAYVTAHGDMRGVAFRVRSVTETLTGIGSVESIMTEPR